MTNQAGEHLVVTDLKSTTNASPDEFQRAIYKFGYHIQGAHYLDGAKVLGLNPKAFAMIAVESEPPHGVAVYQLDPQALAAGHAKRDQLLRLYAQCQAEGRWPGYSESIQPISLPPWALAKEIPEFSGEPRF
jgi:hypothetical protein